jgi:CRP-like cAMP-binding protein
MTLSLEAGMLKQIPMFQDVELAKLKLLALASERLSYAPGEPMFLEGDNPDAVYVILSGAVAVLRDGPSGPVRIAELREGAIVGEVAVLCDSLRTATIAAVNQVSALKIEKATFLDMMMQTPQLAMAVNKELARRLERVTATVVANQPGGKT